MVATEGAKSEVVETLKNGVNNYIVEPIGKDMIVSKVKTALDS